MTENNPKSVRLSIGQHLTKVPRRITEQGAVASKLAGLRQQGIAFGRLARLLSDILGLEISEGALVAMLDVARDAFARQTSYIRARLMSGTILQFDETGLRVGKRNWWLWVFHHDDSAVFVVEPSRGKKVVEGFLGAFRPDFWVSDRYGGQMGWAKTENQVCLAHLIRDVQSQSTPATTSSRLISGICSAAPAGSDSNEQARGRHPENLCRPPQARLDELMAHPPTHTAGVKLQRVIRKIRRHLFVFVTNRAIPATNNGSERALRPCVIFRKITDRFRTEWGARLYADIRSVIETARRRAIRAIVAIRLTLAGKPLPVAA